MKAAFLVTFSSPAAKRLWCSFFTVHCLFQRSSSTQALNVIIESDGIVCITKEIETLNVPAYDIKSQQRLKQGWTVSTAQNFGNLRTRESSTQFFFLLVWSVTQSPINSGDLPAHKGYKHCRIQSVAYYLLFACLPLWYSSHQQNPCFKGVSLRPVEQRLHD